MSAISTKSPKTAPLSPTVLDRTKAQAPVWRNDSRPMAIRMFGRSKADSTPGRKPDSHSNPKSKPPDSNKRVRPEGSIPRVPHSKLAHLVSLEWGFRFRDSRDGD